MLGEKQKVLAEDLSVHCLFLCLSFDGASKPTVQNDGPPLTGGTAAKSLTAGKAVAEFSWGCLPALPARDGCPGARVWESQG